MMGRNAGRSVRAAGIVRYALRMHRLLTAILIFVASLTAASAQTTEKFWEQWGGEPRQLISLLQDGFEIKAALLGSGSEILFVQKGTSAFRCLARLYAPAAPHLLANPLLCYALTAPER